MSSRTITTLAHSLTLVPAALILHSGAAAAANSVDNLLEQQRAVLAGRVVAVSVPANAHHAQSMRSTDDAQEHARRLLLDLPSRARAERQLAASGARGSWVYGDAQVLAQHLLAGRSSAAAGS
jgi:hypothetical protein